MKVGTAILFTVLYIFFSCLAVTSSAVPTCSYTACKNAVFSYKERGEINTDNSQDNCTHKPAVTAHVIQKQNNNTVGGGNKWLLLGRLTLQNCIISSLEVTNSNELNSKAVAPPSCPLFIKNCVLLI